MKKTTFFLYLLFFLTIVGVTTCYADSYYTMCTKYITTALSIPQSLSMRCVLALLLGLLVSFTPCMYPMIPITAGILHAHRATSLLHTCTRALAYTLGLATTFALLGLAAASAGTLFGAFMHNAAIVCFMIGVLAYLAFSLLGFYEPYIPRFMRSNKAVTHTGSIISALVLGAVSGTITSPCVSPALLLMLSIVSTLKSAFLGFLLLFFFGVGLSIPLLFIGIFSASLHLLPHARQWMIEVKRALGLILIGTCFYFLSMLTSSVTTLYCASVSAVLLGIWYLYVNKKVRGIWHAFNNVIGMVLIAASVVLVGQGYLAQHLPSLATIDAWHSDYQSARTLAQHEKKLLFVDVSAPYCSLCTCIEHTILNDSQVRTVLDNFVRLKIDGAQERNAMFIQQYDIKGFPTLLVIDPTHERIVQRWYSNAYDMGAQAYAQELEKILSES